MELRNFLSNFCTVEKNCANHQISYNEVMLLRASYITWFVRSSCRTTIFHVNNDINSIYK